MARKSFVAAAYSDYFALLQALFITDQRRAFIPAFNVLKGGMLNLNNLSYRIDGRPLLDQASARIPTGKRVALFGRNGTGKTTLLRLIQGEIALDDGEIQLNKGASLGAIAQEAPHGPQSLLDTVINSNTELAELKERAEPATDADEVSEIHERHAHLDA